MKLPRAKRNLLNCPKISEIKQSHELNRDLERLVSEMKAKNFIAAYDLSKYIRDNKLRDYPSITGVIEFTRGGDSWTMDGGIDPTVFADICRELGFFDGDRSDARVKSFKSYEASSNSVAW